jgi:hypothetical protein
MDLFRALAECQALKRLVWRPIVISIPRITALALCALAANGAYAQQAPPASPAPAHAAPNTCTTAPYHAFDFWIGEWDVFDRASNQPAGRSSIALHDDGCVIEEVWTGVTPHDTGRSLNMFDITTGKWLQFWMNTIGDVSRFEGGPTPDGMRLAAMNETRPGGTRTVSLGVEWSRLPDGSVRQHGTYSLDGGATWADRYDYIYRHHSG